MEKVVNEINIVPAIFADYREDGNILLKCLQGEEVVHRAFQPELFRKFDNLKYILLGITTGENEMRLRVCDGTEFKDIFEEKWNVLLK